MTNIDKPVVDREKAEGEAGAASVPDLLGDLQLIAIEPELRQGASCHIHMGPR